MAVCYVYMSVSEFEACMCLRVGDNVCVVCACVCVYSVHDCVLSVHKCVCGVQEYVYEFVFVICGVHKYVCVCSV